MTAEQRAEKAVHGATTIKKAVERVAEAIRSAERAAATAIRERAARLVETGAEGVPDMLETCIQVGTNAAMAAAIRTMPLE